MNIKYSSSHKKQEPESGFLYIVGTPIGNLNDISIRALKILENVSLVVCEDTRQTKKIMHRYDFTNNLISFNEHNSFKKIPKLIDDLKSGKSIALVSDAGMPSICDPGEDLIKIARANNIDVLCIPGPCAALTALVSSGFSASSFIFLGFLPKNKKEREKLLLKISESEKTVIIYESPHRLKKLLNELKKFCGGKRQIQIFRELTKKYEEQIGSNIDMVSDYFEKKDIIGEITIVINKKDNIGNSSFNESLIKKELNELVNAGLTLSAASKYLAKKNNIKKSLIYNLY